MIFPKTVFQDLIITGKYILMGDTLIKGDLTIWGGGSLNCNGYDLTVNGTVYLNSSGEISFGRIILLNYE